MARRLAAVLGLLVALLVGLALAVAPAAEAADGVPPALTGVVLGTDGAPLAGVGVDVYQYAPDVTDSTGAERVGGAVTGDDGAWAVALPEGRYSVFLTDRTGERRAEWLDGVRLDRWSTDPLWTTLGDPAAVRTVTGRVLDAAGAPLAGAEVTLFHLYDRGPGSWRYVNQARTTTTDGAGRYVLTTSYASGFVSVAAGLPGQAPTSLDGHARVADDAGLVTTATTVTAPDLRLTGAPTTTPTGTPAPSTTTATLREAARGVRAGSPVVLGVRVLTGARGPVGGRVLVRDGGHRVAAAGVDADGTLRVPVRGLGAGRHALRACYTGDATTAGSCARAVVVRVARR